MSHEFIAPRLAGIVLAATLLTACAPQASTAAVAPPPAATSAPETATTVPAAPLVRGLPDFATLVEQVGPAVVNVTVVEKRQRAGGLGSSNPFADNNDPFSDFFASSRISSRATRRPKRAWVQVSSSVPTVTSSPTRMWSTTPRA